MKIIKMTLLVLFIIGFAGCSGATVKNIYKKEGPNREYKGPENYKRQNIKVTIPEKKKTKEEVTTIVIDDSSENKRKIMTIEKISNDKYIIRIK